MEVHPAIFAIGVILVLALSGYAGYLIGRPTPF